MTSGSTTRPLTSADLSRRGPALGVLAVLLTAALALFLAISRTSHVSWIDSGGYENMLCYFLQSGRVDYMRWSQPTFIGLLPVAVPWSLLFGTSVASLQILGVAYGLALVAGLYLFLIRHVPSLYAALLCAALISSSEFLPFVPTFMSDIPYAAYVVWFLVVHQKLEGADAQETPGRTAWLWTAWGLFFLLACLTRSFSLLLVPLFLVQWMARRSSSGDAAFSRRCFLLAALLSVAALATVRLIGRNGFSPVELTVIPDVVLRHQWARLDLRTLIVSLIQISLLALPGLLISRQMSVRRFSPPEIAAAALGLVAALHFWHKGLLQAGMTLPFVPGGHPALLLLLLVLLLPLSVLLLYRLLKAAFAVAALSSTVQVLIALAVAHLLVLPVMQHPMLRHTLPALIALLMLIAVLGIRTARLPFIVSSVVLLGMTGWNAVTLMSQRTVGQTRWDTAAGLVRSGVPLSEIDGGWGWYCRYHLHPGLARPLNFVTDYAALARSARFVVTETASPPQANPAQAEKVQTMTSSVWVGVIDRRPAANATGESAALR